VPARTVHKTLYSQTFRTPLLEIAKPVPQNCLLQFLKQKEYCTANDTLRCASFHNNVVVCVVLVNIMCCKSARLKGTEQVQRGQVRRKERMKERKKERKKNFKVKSHICDVIMNWPVSMRTKVYVCLLSTAFLHQTREICYTFRTLESLFLYLCVLFLVC
jgi:hypothetical protein